MKSSDMVEGVRFGAVSAHGSVEVTWASSPCSAAGLGSPGSGSPLWTGESWEGVSGGLMTTDLSERLLSLLLLALCRSRLRSLETEIRVKTAVDIPEWLDQVSATSQASFVWCINEKQEIVDISDNVISFLIVVNLSSAFQTVVLILD